MAVADNKNTQSSLDSHVAYGVTGLDMDSSLSQIKEGKLTYALNAIIEGYNGGGQINYQNEFGNEFVLNLPFNTQVIGKRAIIEKNIYVLLLYGFNDKHEIGIFDYKKNTYSTVISGAFLNFNRDYPINKVEYEINGEATRIYWADNYNNDRYLDLNHIPSTLSANILKVQPDFSVPYITISEVTSGGNLIEGTYQFGIQYSDAIGTAYTSVYNISNPTPIFKGYVSQDFNLPTDKSILLQINNLEKQIYQYFNLVVVKTINNISSFEMVGTYPTDITKSILYTGQSNLSLSSEDIFQQFPHYERSQGVTQSDKVLIWHGVTEAKRVNYQEIASNINLQWVKYKIPYYLSYSDSSIAEQYRGYMGDEVYAFEFQPILRSGKECDGFHIPNRKASPYDREIIPNPLYSEEICTTDESSVQRWKIENTATVLSDNSDYIDIQNDPLLSSFQTSISNIKDEITTSNSTIDSNNQAINTKIGDITGWLYNREKGQHSIGSDIGYDRVSQIAELINNRPIDSDSIAEKFTHTNDNSTQSIGRNIVQTADDINTLYSQIINLTGGIVDYNKKLNDLYIQYNTTLKQKGLCAPQPVAYGEFGYYESEELYPDNKEIWGNLANEKIRHHKFPERKIHDSEGNIYPLGVRINIDEVISIIKNSSLSQQEKDDITGFKILRADRAGNKSVIAKGLVNNVGISSREGETYFYPNYPFNDVRVDPFLSSFQTRDDSGANASASLDGFYSEESKKRFTFHSPDTSFYQPSLGDHIKLETIEYGTSIGHHIPVKNHPKYQIPSRAAYATAVAITMGMIAAGSTEGIGPAGLDFLGGSNTPWDEGIQTMLSVIDIINKSIPHKELAYQFNSVGDYNASKDIPDTIQRLYNIDNNSRYISDGLANVDDLYQINNFLRESAVFIKTDNTIPYTHDLYPDIQDTSRYVAGNTNSATTTKTNISTYYVALKNQLSSQYGSIYSYKTIDTGYYFDLGSNSGTTVDIFGGDIYISRFAYKTKQSFFTQNLVGREDNLGLDFRNYGNIAYPTYWMSNERDGKITWGDILQEAAGIYNGAQAGALGSMSLGGTIRGAVAGAILGGIGVLLDNNQNNFDDAGKKFFYQDGKFYLFAYGIPYFWVESEVNCNYRQAFNGKEGDFYPHVGGNGIPDDWLQEYNVPIVNDNSYWYNKTFSKQNKESFTSHIPNDYTPDYQLTHDNKAIYSEKQSSETNYKINKWLLYRPVSYYDFPQTNGKLISLDSIENRAVLARFENKSELYNAMLRVDTSNPQAIYLGNSTLFTSAPPIDYATTDTGYMGSHHKLLLRTEYGSVSVDSERGMIFIIDGQKAKDISGTISKFLAINLPFKIKDSFPDINIDNAFNGIGLSAVYDFTLSRVIITKLDYKPLMEDISYINGGFVYNNRQIDLTDSTYFENHCFTISYDFKTQSWVSFHDYFPNFYLTTPDNFFTNSGNALWVHNNSLNKFNIYYGIPSSYIIEYPFSYKVTDEILQCIKDYTKVYQFNNPDDSTDFSEVDNIYFDESLLYSDKQCSGILKLNQKPVGNMASYIKYPIYDTDSKTILYTKSNRYYQYNTFWSLVKDTTKPLFKRAVNLSLIKEINNDNMDYSKRSFKKTPLMTSNLRVRHTLNSTNDYKILSQFLLTQTQQSFK